MYQSKQMARVEEKLDRILTVLEKMAAPAPPPAPPASDPEPLPGYDGLNVAEALDALKDMNKDKAFVGRVLAYERANKNRSGVVDTLVGWNG